MNFDIAVASYNTDFYLLHLLQSVRRVLPPGSFGRCHVWDNGSTDGSRAVLRALDPPGAWLVGHESPVNLHHGPALDRLLREHCTADWVLVLDSDTRLRTDFRAALPPLDGERPAFIGQVHPELDPLYAYMCHLLVHRDWYRELPPFDADGAPGRRFFRAVAERGIHWRRFRWVDHVEHYGQGTLHGVHARGETAHPLYWWVEAQSRRPHWPAAVRREAPLREALARFLAEHARDAPPAPTARLAPAVAAAPAATAPPAPARRRGRRWPFGDITTARLVRRAATFGLAQHEAELRRLVRRVRWLRPRRVLELGASAGGTLFLWTRAARAGATLVSAGVPPWEPDDPGEPGRRRTVEGFARRGQRLHVLRGDPAGPAMQADVRARLGDRPVDFLFLTGEPDAGRLRALLAAYAPLVRAGGLIALDGIRPRAGARDGLAALWREVRARARTRELVARRDQAGFGIGLVRRSRGTPPGWP